MKFKVNGIIKEITLKVWDNKHDCLAYGGVDIFGDIETGVQTDSRFVWDDEAEAWVCSEEMYDRVVDFWREETAKYNVRERSWFTEGFSEDEMADEFAKDLEFLFDYD